MAPRVSHTQFMFRYVFQIYAFCEVISLNVVNYCVRFQWKRNINFVGIILILIMAVLIVTTGIKRDT